MCVLSMVIDHQTSEWERRYPSTTPAIFWTNLPSPQEIEEFTRLLERARKYDEEHNQPDCELAEKKNKLLKLADELGVEIDFR